MKQAFDRAVGATLLRDLVLIGPAHSFLFNGQFHFRDVDATMRAASSSDTMIDRSVAISTTRYSRMIGSPVFGRKTENQSGRRHK
jgi:hypothetical protein